MPILVGADSYRLSMATRRYSQPSDGSVFLGILGVLFLVGLVIKYIWWFVGAAVVVGVGVAVWALVREEQKRRQLAEDEAADREFELQRKADRQHRWMLMGDSRAIYGEAGKPLRIPMVDADEAAAESDPTIARMATTPAEVDALVRDKPRGWEQSLFASILVQRRTAVAARLRDSELGFPAVVTAQVFSGREVARCVLAFVNEMLSTMRQIERFMGAPAFMGAFSGADDESEADPEAIRHIANRTMDFHERLLELSERCRGLSVPLQYEDVVADCALLLDGQLQSFREFIDDFVDVVEALPRVLGHATGPVNLGNLGLYLSVDDTVRTRMFKRMDEISGS